MTSRTSTSGRLPVNPTPRSSGVGKPVNTPSGLARRVPSTAQTRKSISQNDPIIPSRTSGSISRLSVARSSSAAQSVSSSRPPQSRQSAHEPAMPIMPAISTPPPRSRVLSMGPITGNTPSPSKPSTSRLAVKSAINNSGSIQRETSPLEIPTSPTQTATPSPRTARVLPGNQHEHAPSTTTPNKMIHNSSPNRRMATKGPTPSSTPLKDSPIPLISSSPKTSSPHLSKPSISGSPNGTLFKSSRQSSLSVSSNSIHSPDHSMYSMSQTPSASPLPAVPWSSSGMLTSSNQPTSQERNSFLMNPHNPSPGRALWEVGTQNGGDGFGYGDEEGYGDNATFDMMTDIGAGEVDEEMQAALQAVEDIHLRKTTHFNRLLEKTQSSSASQLHALQAEIRQLRDTLDSERSRLHEEKNRSYRMKEALDRERNDPSTTRGGFDIVSAMRGDGFGGFDETEIRRAVRGLRQPDRMRLINIILDACLPGDIPLMISLLQRYALTSFDILTHLPRTLSSKVLGYLSIPELLECELVSQSWLDMCRDDILWRAHCERITRWDPVPVKKPSEPGGWRIIYRSLHSREENWSLGLVQNVRILKGHTGFCTTLNLKGRRLISGSYDETIRVWDIDTGEEKKCLKVKAVSCIDFLDEEETFAVGFHDVGRVQIWSSLTWTLLQTLQGHLYGIRAIAISPNYLVSAGADKAIVAWDWRSGNKIVRFGQQTNLCIGVQIMDEERIVSVTIDGIVRTFSIRRREMLAQFALNELISPDPLSARRLSSVGVGPNNMLQWFAAKGTQMTCATKSVILHLVWENAVSTSPTEAKDTSENGRVTPISPTILMTSGRPRASSSLSAKPRSSLSLSTSSATLVNGRESRTSTPSRAAISPLLRKVSGGPRQSMSPRSSMRRSLGGPVHIIEEEDSLSAAPKLVAVFETPDVAVGAVDPRKRRVATSTRFSSRLGADRRIFVSTYAEDDLRRGQDATVTSPPLTLADLDPSISSTSSSSTPITPISPVMPDAFGIAQIRGAWETLADESAVRANAKAGANAVGHGSIPPNFKGFATPDMNPMAMALNHEEVIVGCANGTIYVMSFVGYRYSVKEARARARAEAEALGLDVESIS